MRKQGFTSARVTLFLAWLVPMICCVELPDDFPDLPLEEKVEAYSHYLENLIPPQGHPDPGIEGRGYISLHGYEAAELMASLLTGEKTGLPKGEAVQIIRLVQLRGCDLRGARAEQSLIDFLTGNASESGVEREHVEHVLRLIRRNASMPNSLFPPGRGACPSSDGA